MPDLFAFAADLHLQPNAWVRYPDLHGDAYESLRQLVDFCIEHSLPLILGGDVFDRRRPDSDSVNFYARQMDRMQMAGIYVYFVQGDHEYAEVPWMKVHAWPVWLSCTGILYPTIRVAGIDWTPREQLPEVLAQVPIATNVLVMHQRWDELQGIGVTDGSVSQIPHARYLLTGDYHGHRCVAAVNAQGQPLHVYSPGSTCMQAIDEDPNKYFFVARTDAATGEFVMRAERLVARAAARMRVNSADDLAAFLAWLPGFVADSALGRPSSLQRPILQVRYRSDIPEAYQRVTAAAGSVCHLFLDPIAVTEEVVVDEEAAPEGAFDTLSDAVGQLASHDEQLRNGSRRLLDSPEPAVELDRMHAEFSGRLQVRGPC